MKTCKEVMTANPTCCTPDETVTRIAKLMKTENVGSIPICENRDSKKLIGIVTDRDLAIQVVAAAKDPHAVKASDIMTGNPITCRPDDDLQTALEAMEPRPHRIQLHIPPNPVKLPLIPNRPIITLLLPKRLPTHSQHLVPSRRRNPLERSHQLRYRHSRSHQQMHMIRHQDERVKLILFQ